MPLENNRSAQDRLEVSENAAGVVTGLYTLLILRDFFGKIVPGTILISGFVLFASSPETLNMGISSLTFLTGMIGLGYAWLAGLVAQALLTIASRRRSNRKKELALRRIEFDRVAPQVMRQQLERFVVIKEATGNSAVALLLGIILYVLGLIVSDDGLYRDFAAPTLVGLLLVVIIVIGLLLWFWRDALKNQEDYLKAVRKKLGIKKGSINISSELEKA